MQFRFIMAVLLVTRRSAQRSPPLGGACLCSAIFPTSRMMKSRSLNLFQRRQPQGSLDVTYAVRPAARFKRILAFIARSVSFGVHPFLKCRIAVKTVCEQLITLRQRVAGIRVQ